MESTPIETTPMESTPIEPNNKIEKEEISFLVQLVEEIIYSPLNLILLTICVFLLYKILVSGRRTPTVTPVTPEIKPLKKQDLTLQQMRQYNGTDPDGRVCVAVNGKVFDVTKGRRFYGPGGPYSAFAGKDASRGLATFTVEAPKDDVYDDLSDLSPMEMEGVKEWEIQFTEKYSYVGRLLKPGEEPTEYSDEESSKKEATPDLGPSTKSKDE